MIGNLLKYKFAKIVVIGEVLDKAIAKINGAVFCLT